jgi:tetratricopeptide (TPR) repeat protein
MTLDPDHPFPYFNLAASYIYRHRLTDAHATLQKASERSIDIPEFFDARYQMAFLENNPAEMKRLALSEEGSRAKDWRSDWTYDHEGFVLAYSGRLQQARKKSRQAVDVARQAGRRDGAAQHEAAAAVRETLFGFASEGRLRAMSALDLSHGRDAQYGAALALALAGDSARSQTLADDLQSRFPEDTLVRISYLPALRAVLAVNRREPFKAIELLEAAAPYELGYYGSASVGFVGSLYPIYVRGIAYLAGRHGGEAAREFQKILDHRGIVVSDPIGAVARLQLGRAFALVGDTLKAKTAYQDFLTLWKDADPDIPIVKEARAEYARLP